MDEEFNHWWNKNYHTFYISPNKETALKIWRAACEQGYKKAWSEGYKEGWTDKELEHKTV